MLCPHLAAKIALEASRETVFTILVPQQLAPGDNAAQGRQLTNTYARHAVLYSKEIIRNSRN